MFPAVNQDVLVKTFTELVQIDAVSRHERPVVDFIIQKLNAWNLTYYEDNAGLKIGGNAGNLIVTVPGKGDYQFFLGAHTDTVRPTAGLVPVIKDGVIYSGGQTILGADNRAGVSILLYLLEQAAHQRFSHCPFEVTFTIAEEIGLLGATYLAWDELKSDMGFIFDSSLPPGDYIAVTPTAIELDMTLVGKPAHAGVAPEKGINAISMAAEVLAHFPVGRVDKETVANIGLIEGGEATNVVAGKVHMAGEIRSFNSKTIEKMIRELENCLQAVSQKYGGTYEFRHDVHFSGFRIPEEHLLARRLKEKMAKVGLVSTPKVYHGGSDANVCNARGKTAINLGIGAKNPHGNDEHIAIADLVKMAELAQALVEVEA